MPKTIMLIRHGEKPVVPPPYGIDDDGTENKHALTVRGWQRAGALIPFFRTPWADGIVTPTVIYASGVSDVQILVDGDDVAKSYRPQQTVAPLATALSLAIRTQHCVGQEADLIEAMKADTGAVLVAWEHKHIPAIAAGFTDSAPDSWPGGEVYDVVWILAATNGGYRFTSVAQDLLAGDSR